MSLPIADNEKGMFVVISYIELKKESMQQFKEWFERSNTVVATFDGFAARKLLESPDGQHRIIIM